MNPLMNFSTGNSRYYKQFNLSIDPFPAEEDNILYLTPGINLRLERIKESIAGSQKTIVITSSPGAGKSMLADYLESQPESNWKICLVKAEDGMTTETIAFEIIRQAMPDKAKETSRAIPLLHKYLEMASRNNFVPVFIIDDADKLSLETLKFLLELATLRYADSLFRIVLFADESLIDRLADPELNSLVTGMTYNLHLPSLSRSQSTEYIDTRLHAAGEISDYPFNEENLDYIYRISGGLPAGINIAARQLMQSRNVTTAPEPVRSSGGKWLAAVVVLLAGVILRLPIAVPGQYRQPAAGHDHH